MVVLVVAVAVAVVYCRSEEEHISTKNSQYNIHSDSHNYQSYKCDTILVFNVEKMIHIHVYCSCEAHLKKLTLASIIELSTFQGCNIYPRENEKEEEEKREERAISCNDR